MACAAENPGTIPRPTTRNIHCFLCAATYHPGDWCLPAGSIELAPNWIICPRHSLQSGKSLSLNDLSRPNRDIKMDHTFTSENSSVFDPICKVTDNYEDSIYATVGDGPEEINLSGCQILQKYTRTAIHKGSFEALESILIRDDHRSLISNLFRPANVTWCFICSRGGCIICCENCPASFHQECIRIKEVPDQFVCEECTNGRLPRYGEILWVRIPPVGHPDLSSRMKCLSSTFGFLKHIFPPSDCADLISGMRWWPAESFRTPALSPIGKSSSSPVNRLGFFPVRLFGLYSATPFEEEDAAQSTEVSHFTMEKVHPVCLWTTNARVFPFEEGDDDKRDSEVSEYSDSGNLSIAEEDPLMNESTGSVRSLKPSGRTRLLLCQPREGRCGRDGVVANDWRGPQLRCRPPGQKSKLLATAKRCHSRHPVTSAARRRRRVYRTAVLRAAEGWRLRKEKFAKILGRRKPDYYKPIKTNYPIGSVRTFRLTDISEALQCDCKAMPNIEPCGPNSDCINRELHYECLASVCRHGENCRNQYFTRRDYPPQEIFWTGDERGWGLKAVAPILKGEFVNEYTGDLIDEEEANRRLKYAHENNVKNYYMMKMDSQRIIDAGPKGNLSRFMNHSCQPNLNTEKWTVNGDTKVGLFAVRDIAAGEELTFNYNFVAWGQDMQNCHCGAPNCFGYLGARAEHSTQSIASTSTEQNGVGNVKHHQDNKMHATKRCGVYKGAHQQATSMPKTALLTPDISGEILNHRHDNLCYRCGKDALGNSTSRLRSRSALKRKAPSKNTDGTYANDLITSHDSHSSNNQAEALVLCSKSDCTKVYHLRCLDLKSHPTGCWYCPWHHCDACGRPATVFCMLCPTAFCPGHVEGSVAVLPPTKACRVAGGFVALVVCLSHVDVINTVNKRKRSRDDSFDSQGVEPQPDYSSRPRRRCQNLPHSSDKFNSKACSTTSKCINGLNARLLSKYILSFVSKRKIHRKHSHLSLKTHPTNSFRQTCIIKRHSSIIRPIPPFHLP